MFQVPQNKIVIKVKDKYIQHMSNILRLSSLENNTSIDPADFVSIVGEVVNLPRMVTDDIDHAGFSIDNIKVGDTAIFSYQVIYDIVIKANTDKLEFRNMVTYQGVEYFLADINKIFGVIRDGEIHMVNGWVMLTEYPKKIIILQNESKKTKGTVVSEVMYCGSHKTNKKSLNIKQNDKVLLSPFRAQHYHINRKPFIILRNKDILAKV